jgi:hypothetical protein
VREAIQNNEQTGLIRASRIRREFVCER